MTADGRTIPKHRYRREDLVDDSIDGSGGDPSAEGFCTTTVQRPRDEVREPGVIYRIASG